MTKVRLLTIALMVFVISTTPNNERRLLIDEVRLAQTELIEIALDEAPKCINTLISLSMENEYAKLDLYIYEADEPVSFENYPQFVDRIEADGHAKKDGGQFEINTHVNYGEGAELHLKNFKKVTFTTDGDDEETDHELMKMKFKNITNYDVKWMDVFNKFQALSHVTINTVKHAKYKSPNETNSEKELKAAIKEAQEYYSEVEVTFDEDLKYESEAGCSCNIL